jgi:hypothetical protein
MTRHQYVSSTDQVVQTYGSRRKESVRVPLLSPFYSLLPLLLWIDAQGSALCGPMLGVLSALESTYKKPGSDGPGSPKHLHFHAPGLGLSCLG